MVVLVVGGIDRGGGGRGGAVVCVCVWSRRRRALHTAASRLSRSPLPLASALRHEVSFSLFLQLDACRQASEF